MPTKTGKRGKEDLSRGLSSFAKPTSAVETSLPSSSQHVLDFILSSARADERPFLRVNVFGRMFLGLLDSGASRTIIGESGWRYLKPLDLKMTNLSNSVRIANGDKVEVLGSVNYYGGGFNGGRRSVGCAIRLSRVDIGRGLLASHGNRTESTGR